MRKKMIYGAFALVLAALLVVSGMTAGARLEAGKNQDKAEFFASQSTTIAILSMDAGAQYQAGEIVFAEEIIASLPATYTLVSREVGEKGLSEGSYGALITFPADFSQCLTTINSMRPLTAQFSYKLNMNLPEDALLAVMTDILKLEREVNDRLSYMFISSVFEEFHDAQSRVSAVLANDEADLKALSQIQSRDLVAKLQLTTLPQDIPDFRSADISERTSDNQAIMGDLDESYKKYLQLAMDEAKDLSDETDKTVKDETTGLASFKKSIDELTWLPQIQSGTDAFTQIGEASSATITAFEQTLTEPIMDVDDLLNAMQLSELDTRDYEKAREKTIRAMLTDQQAGILIDMMPQPIANPTPPAMQTPNPPPPQTSSTDPGDYDPFTDTDFLAAMEAVRLASPTDYVTITNAIASVRTNSMDKGFHNGLLQGQGEGQAQGFYDGLLQGQIEGQAQGVYDGRADANDHYAAEYATATNLFDPDDFYDGYDKSRMMDQFRALKRQYATNTNLFKDDLSGKVDRFNAEVTDGYDEFRISLSDLDDKITELTDVQRIAMESYGTDQISSLHSAFTEKKNLIEEIAAKILAFNPLRHITENQAVFNEFSTRFKENVSGIQTEVSEQVAHDNEQLNKLYQNHIEYTAALKEDIHKTKDEGDVLLTEALQGFYDAKMDTSISNVENMQAFAGKLPNSHLGNLGNNNLFNFMASPIQSIDSDPLARPALPRHISQVEFLHEDTILYIIAAGAILILAGIVSFFSVSVVHDYRLRKRYEEDYALSPETVGEA